MFKTRFNYKFKKIIALSTLAAIGCSSNLIQSMEEQNVDDLILSLTQEDRKKLLELISNQETVNAPTDFKALNYPCTLSRYGKVQDNDELDDVGDHCRGWIHADIDVQPQNNDEKLSFDLIKNKKDDKIYFACGGDVRQYYLHYEELKGTEFDPEKHENRIWKRPKDFKKLCDKLFQQKRELEKQKKIVISEGFDRFAKDLGMSPKVGLGVAVALGAVGLGGGIISISR